MAVINPYNYSMPKQVVLKQVNQSKQARRYINQSKTSKKDAYLVQKVMNAKPEELTMMLYEGMVKFIKLAKDGVAKKNYQQTNENSIKAQNIVAELHSTLDKSFEHAEEWGSLYDFIDSELIEGNIKKEEKHFDNALEIAEELAYTWREVIRLA